VPFFINSAGYGIYIPSTYYSIFNIGTYRSDMAGFTANTGGSLSSTFDYYFFAGTPKTILDRYTSLSGRPQLPPKWAFGPWMSANEWHTQTQVTNTLNNMNSYNIPATVLVLEQWSDEATFYIWHDAQYTPKSGDQSFRYSDFTFPSTGAWQDPKAMVTDAHSRGVKVVLWQIPVLKQDFNTNPSTAPPQHLNDMSYAQAQNYVIGDGNGGQYRIPSGQWFGDSMMPDFTNSAATNWWLSKRSYLLNDVGVDGFKDDGGEMVFGRNLTFADGRKGDQMHNAYPGAYTGAYNTYLHSQVGSNGTLFSRGGTAGAQGTSIYWSGDQSSTFGSFQEAVRAGISAGASGVPFWSWDLAGFTGGFPTSELYLRAAAMAAFAPVMQYHSEGSNPSPSEERTPWNVQARTGDTTVIPTFQKFADVRMNLIPYIYTEAKRSADTGAPMMRAMGVEFPSDPNATTLDQQYMFGDQLLVAPVTTQGATTENVYVPSGEWYDVWNSGRFTGGGTKSYGVPLNLIPVYARPGAIIPLNLNANYQLGGAIGNSVTTYTNLTFRIYPDGVSSYGYYDDATATTRTIQSAEAWGSHNVTVSMPAMPTASTLQVIATQPSAVTRDGTTLTGYSTLSGLQSASEGWYWDPVLQATLVKLPASANARSIVLSGADKASYEGEFATASGTTTNTNHANYTGSGFVDGFDAAGKSVSFDVNASAAAAYQLRFRYANALGATATRQVYVDNTLVGTLNMPALTNWDTWGTASLGVTLGQGKHTIKIAYEASNSTAINLDNLTLARQ